MTGNAVAGLVLAGGRGSRLGEAVPKPLVHVGGRPLISHVLERFLRTEPCLSPILIGVNDIAPFVRFGFPVVPDRMAGYQGPLASLEAASDYLERLHPSVGHLLVLPGDTPFLPMRIAATMLAKRSALPQVAVHAGKLQPGVALWPLSCLHNLSRYLANGGGRSIKAFLTIMNFEAVDIPRTGEQDGIDPFFNVNTPSDLEQARAALKNCADPNV